MSSDDDQAVMCGELDIEVLEARNLPDMDNFFLSKLIDKNDVTDSFVSGYLDTTKVFMTSIKDNTLNPRWNEKFHVTVCHQASQLRMDVADKDHARSEAIGSVTLNLAQLEGDGVGGWHKIIDKRGKQKGELKLTAKFTNSKELMTAYLQESLADLSMAQYRLPAYFPARSDCQARLYSCAANSTNPVVLSSGEVYQPAGYFLDVYRSLVASQELIYITGWSIWTDLKLIRRQEERDQLYGEERDLADLTLGKLLIEKARMGVRVLVMVWSDLSSLATGEGMMGTHDQQTVDFFKLNGNGVECVAVAREVGLSDASDLVNTSFAKSYTHHQKSVVCDEPSKSGGQSTLVAYLGGIDLTDGRYDTPEHPLFSSLATGGVHSEDFYQACAPGVTTSLQGPRQPWQDIHCQLKGRVALDVAINFSERWRKQASLKSSSLLSLSESSFDLNPQAGNWNCQIVRSITNDSASFPDQGGQTHNLTVKKSTLMEESINRAYVKLIRTAERFIYIENQYFLGSAYAWPTDSKVQCHHTIPAEIAEKVSEMILEGKQFCAYIVIPLHPEGDPAAAATQEILAWQRRTMAMMYRRVGQALRQAGSSAHPQDHLLFLTPLAREDEDEIPDCLEENLEPGSNAEKLRSSRRLMIYVHSKLMVVDDSAAIIGSANINQRSLAGSRDTELAVVLHQPEHTLLTAMAEEKELPEGDLARFRLRLMEEHLGTGDTSLMSPHTEACNAFVREKCVENWEGYIDQDGGRRPGHLVLYPIEVSPHGEVSSVQDFFPDTSALIQGTKSSHLPGKLTT